MDRKRRFREPRKLDLEPNFSNVLRVSFRGEDAEIPYGLELGRRDVIISHDLDQDVFSFQKADVVLGLLVGPDVGVVSQGVHFP